MAIFGAGQQSSSSQEGVAVRHIAIARAAIGIAQSHRDGSKSFATTKAWEEFRRQMTTFSSRGSYTIGSVKEGGRHWSERLVEKDGKQLRVKTPEVFWAEVIYLQAGQRFRQLFIFEAGKIRRTMGVFPA